ncbi:MAG: hypothetical protein IVW51_06645 [Thermaceae bacterium]|nr:hypothetical protein [Thermaceae bacterium]
MTGLPNARVSIGEVTARANPQAGGVIRKAETMLTAQELSRRLWRLWITVQNGLVLMLAFVLVALATWLEPGTQS